MTTQNQPIITLLGLGPGDPQLLTREAWDVIQSAQEIHLRTRQHPAIADFPAGLAVHSFDALYEQSDSFETVYTRIVEQVLELGMRPQGVIYAVPGHPFIAEATGPEIVRRATELGGSVRVLSGISFLEAVYAALGLDPFPRASLMDAFDLSGRHVPPFPPDVPVLVAQIHSRQMASEVKLTLMSVYSDTHPVKLVHAAGTARELVEALPLYEMDRSPHIGLLTSLYVPPLGEYSSIESFMDIVARLRAPDGCPWDREQTHLSLREHLLEETYEVLEALDAEEMPALGEELGDLLFQVVFHAQIASENGDFDFAGVVRGIAEKLVRRHPHVFGEVSVSGVDDMLKNWERIKAAERAGKGQVEQASILNGVLGSLPALAQASALQRKAAGVGFDWPDVDGVLAKLVEEVGEFTQAVESERESELGDVLFVLAHLANWYGINPEDALRGANLRFRARFGYVEAAAARTGKKVSDFSLDELNGFWDQAKARERGLPESE